MTRSHANRLVLSVLILVSASNAIAQGPAAPGLAIERGTGAEAVANAFGLGPQDHWVSVLEFSGGNTGTTANLTWNLTAFPYFRQDGHADSGVFLFAPLRLPAGASLTSMQCFFRNQSTGQNIIGSVTLYRAWHDLTTNTPGFLALGTVATTPGVFDYGRPSTAVAETIRYSDGNRRNMYVLELFLPNVIGGGFGFFSLAGCNFVWNRQVTPAPASATFADVPVGHQQFRFVEALVAAGITAGCGGGNYCPDQAITRGQMAVFLAAALGLHFPN